MTEKGTKLEAKDVPAPAPGRVVDVPLDLFAAYRDLHGLVVDSVEWFEGRLWVRFERKERMD